MWFVDGCSFVGMVVGWDFLMDFVLFCIVNVKDLFMVMFGDFDELEIGDWVVVIGNLFGFDMLVMYGFILVCEWVIGVGLFDDFI